MMTQRQLMNIKGKADKQNKKNDFQKLKNAPLTSRKFDCKECDYTGEKKNLKVHIAMVH